MKLYRCVAVLGWWIAVTSVQGQADTIASASYLIEATRLLLLDEKIKAEQALVQSLEADTSNSAACIRYASLYASHQNYEKAYYYIDQALTLTPEYISYYLLGAHIALQVHHFPKAISYYEALLAHLPARSFNYYQKLADLYTRTHAPAKALALYQEYEEKFRYTKALGVARAQLYQSQDDLVSERSELLRLTRTFASDPMTHKLYVAMLFRSASYAEALNYLYDVLEKYPYSVLLTWHLGQAHLKNHQYRQAGDVLFPLLQEASISMEEKLTLLHLESPPYNKAHIHFLQQTSALLLQYYPQHLRLYTTAANLAKATHAPPTQLRGYYSAMLNLGLRTLWLWQEVISLELTLQAYDSAATYIQEALTYYPNQPMLHYYHGRLLYLQQHYAEAQEVLLQAQTFAITAEWKSKLTLQLAETYYALGKLEQAETTYLKAIQAQPLHTQEAQIAYILFLLQENRGASTALRLAAELMNHDRDQTNIMLYVRVLHSQAQCTRAKEVLTEEISRQKSSEILQWLGKVYECLGEQVAAQKSFEEAQKLKTQQ